MFLCPRSIPSKDNKLVVCEKKTNSKNLNVRTNSVDNSLINAMGEFNKSLPLAENVVNEANSLELSKANKLVNSTTQQISSLKLNRSTSSDKELSTQEAMRQPSRVSAKIQQLLNTLKVRIKRNWLRLLISFFKRDKKTT